MDLDSMKYAELRTLAKELGLRANLKADKLLKLIKQHLENNEKEQEQDAAAAPEEATVKEDGGEEVSGPAGFVNTRRGRGKSLKRKIPGAEGGEQPGPTPAEADAEEEADPLPRGGKEPKKRRVSFVKDSDQTEPEAPEETDAEQQQQQQQQDDDGVLKDAAPAQNEAEKATKASNPGRIPRYRGGAQQSKKALKPVTPNFKKLHEAHFNKMESIDTYVQRKTKQMDSYKASAKDAKKPEEKTKPVNASRTSLFSPALPVKKTTEGKRRQETGGKDEVLFRPSVLSTRRINVRFSEATRDNEHKRSLVKTPARASLSAASVTPLRLAAETKSNKTPGTFVFTGNTSTVGTPGTQKKPTFDLKASLSRPLGYKPHKGKLKPFAEKVKENKTTANKSVVPDSHQTSYKQHQVQTRDNRRERHMADRRQKKENLLGARRGLVMM